MSNIEVFINGGEPLTLTQKDFKAAGGEGRIFLKNSRAYKVYIDPSKMIPTQKIKELAALDKPYIFKPENLLMDRKGNVVGHDMRAIEKTIELTQVFPKAFRDREKVTHDQMRALVLKMQEGIEHVHSKGILLVDLNELNFLVDESPSDQVYFIDVNSYQTKSYPATVIMDSYRDWHAKKFDVNTDWYSFALVAAQLFVGIHPYRGKHPSFANDGDMTARLVKRMKANVSIFNPDVKVPHTVYPLDVIPQEYREWLTAVLDLGKRCPPPAFMSKVQVQAARVVRVLGSNHFKIDEAFVCLKDIYYYENGVALAQDGVYVNGKLALSTLDSVRIGFTPKSRKPIVARIEKGALRLFDVQGQNEISASIVGDQLMHYEGRLYIKQATTLYEIVFIESGSSIVASPVAVANVTEKSTQVFEGVAIQNILGSFYASVLASSRASHQVRLNELDGYRIVDARYDSRVLMVVAEKGGKFDRFVLSFEKSLNSHETRIVADVPNQGLNFISLESKSVCITLNEQEEIEVFRIDNPNKINVFKDQAITGDALLFKSGEQAMFSSGNRIFRFQTI